MANIKFTDRSKDVLRALLDDKEEALEAIGLAAEGYAKKNLTEFPRVDTGRLRSSISHARDGDNEYIGTNVEYAPYVDLGTVHMAPAHFLKNAAADHGDEYKQIAKKYLSS